MTHAAPPADPTPHPRRELRAQRRRAREAERPPGERRTRIGAGHRVFLHEHGEPFFGPGVFDLLVLVEASGSLRKAAQSLGMAYSKAWRVLGQAEDHLGLELLHRQAGGSAGGGSALTGDGRELVTRFRALIDEADADLQRLYQKHFGDLPYAQPDASRPEEPETRS